MTQLFTNKSHPFYKDIQEEIEGLKRIVKELEEFDMEATNTYELLKRTEEAQWLLIRTITEMKKSIVSLQVMRQECEDDINRINDY